MIAYDYVYDFANHPYISEFLDQDSGRLVQSFRIPDGVTALRGVRLRLSKYGDPGPLYYALSRQTEGAGLVTASILPEQVLPVFELLVGGDFAPVPVQPGETLYLSLWAENARRPLDAYRVYGPNTRPELVNEGNARVPYWWHEAAERLDDVNAPLPTRYAGANYPPFAGGARLGPDGLPTWSISFNILTDIDPPQTGADEQQFEFAAALLAEPFAEWRSLRDPTQRPAPGEIEIDSTWSITCQSPASPVLTTALAELPAFFARVMGVSLPLPPLQGFGESWQRFAANSPHYSFSPPLGEGPGVGQSHAPSFIFQLTSQVEMANPEAFRVDISTDQVLIEAAHPRGFLRGVYWLEDQCLLRRAPILACGDYHVQPRYDVRMVPGIYPAPSYFMLREAQMWTPGYMWRLSRAGYNAVYFQASLEDFVTESAIFPECADPEAPAAIERLRRSVELGARYGVDFYWDIKTGYEHKFPDSVYQRLPRIKSFEKFGNFPCTGQAPVLDFLRETIERVFTEVEALKGIIMVYDTEGFYSCITHNSKDKCPYCREYPIEELAGRLFQALKDAARVRHPDRELVLLTYICDEPWNYRVIEHMPADVTLVACYSQLKELERGGMKILTDDYSLCSSEPSNYFLKVRQLAKQKGLRFWAKTEDTFGQEFVSTPYTPCLEQHQRRWDSLAAQQVDGFLSQYLHIGFMPTPCQDLMRQNVFDVWRDGTLQQPAPAQKLRAAAVLNSGRETAELVVRAWQAFSVAIRDDFPYTWGVCRYPGPLQSAPGQPFYLDPAREMPRRWARGYVNDLQWTGIVERFRIDKDKTWDERLVSACFQRMLASYRRGCQHLEDAIRLCAPADRPALVAAHNVAAMQASQVRTLVNLIEFFHLRAEFQRRPTPQLRDSLIYVLENELDNASAALVLARRDSRLGFSCEGDGNVRGGHFNPHTIAQKLAGLQQTLEGLYSLPPEGAER